MLKHVVEEYVRSATPVSSEVIVRRYEPTVSSATVRNELDRVGNRLTALLDESSAGQAVLVAAALEGIERQAALAVARILEHADQQAFEDVYYEGLGHILSQPEFTLSQKAVPLVQV